jgi:hypothetical protein
VEAASTSVADGFVATGGVGAFWAEVAASVGFVAFLDPVGFSVGWVAGGDCLLPGPMGAGFAGCCGGCWNWPGGPGG